MRKLLHAVLPAVALALVLAVASTASAQTPSSAGPTSIPPSAPEAAAACACEPHHPDHANAHFSDELHLVLLQNKNGPSLSPDGRSLWAIQESMTYTTHAGDKITLPKGMVTDLASIPRILSSVLPPDGPWVEIAVFHDLLYKTQGTGVYHGHPSITRATPYSRKEADQILRDGMGDLGISGWRSWAIYNGVRVGGGAGWSH